MTENSGGASFDGRLTGWPEKPLKQTKYSSKEDFITCLAAELYKAQNFDSATAGTEQIAKRSINRAQTFWNCLPDSYKDAILAEDNLNILK